LVLQRVDLAQEKAQLSAREQWPDTKPCREAELASNKMMRVHKQVTMIRILTILDNSRCSSLVDKKICGVRPGIPGRKIVLPSRIRGDRREVVILGEVTQTGVTGSEACRIAH
jgi:hypothetical protein